MERVTADNSVCGMDVTDSLFNSEANINVILYIIVLNKCII